MSVKLLLAKRLLNNKEQIIYQSRLFKHEQHSFGFVKLQDGVTLYPEVPIPHITSIIHRVSWEIKLNEESFRVVDNFEYTMSDKHQKVYMPVDSSKRKYTVFRV